jgi:cell division protease FtsH
MTDKKPSNDTPDPTSFHRQPSTWGRLLVWILFLLAFSLYWSNADQQQASAISYTEFKDRVRADRVGWITLQGDWVSGGLQQVDTLGSEGGDRGSSGFTTTLPPIADPELMSLLEQHGVEVRARSEQATWWMRILTGVLPWVLIIGLFWYASGKIQSRMTGLGGSGSIFGFGKSRAKRFQRGESGLSFGDVAGLENAKQDLREITGYLKDPDHYRKLGAKVPRGVLLMGPPGTGKTLLAKAVAGEANVPFFSISGSEFIEMFVGVGASRVRDLFESARKEAPSIIFIDEIDSVGRARGTGLGGGNDEREQTLNQILGEMDGFDPHETVVVLAATNRPDVLDSALMRPGRFDRKITLDLPDKKARLAILKIHSSGVPLAGDVDLDRLSALTVGFSGADLENLINEAALHSARDDRPMVYMAGLLDARDKVVLGGKREMVIDGEEKKLIAYHEAGHALVASLMANADPLDKVTIIPRGRTLGATEQIPGEERHNLQESYLHDRIAVMLGGRVSEQLIFGELSSGAEQDLKQATRLARHMVTHWGMSERLGPVAFARGEEHIFLGREMTQQRDFSEHTAQIIDEEICKLVRGIEGEVAKLLETERGRLDALAEALLEHETLGADAIRAIVETPAPTVEQPRDKATRKRG